MASKRSAQGDLYQPGTKHATAGVEEMYRAKSPSPGEGKVRHIFALEVPLLFPPSDAFTRLNPPHPIFYQFLRTLNGGDGRNGISRTLSASKRDRRWINKKFSIRKEELVTRKEAYFNRMRRKSVGSIQGRARVRSSTERVKTNSRERRASKGKAARKEELFGGNAPTKPKMRHYKSAGR